MAAWAYLSVNGSRLVVVVGAIERQRVVGLEGDRPAAEAAAPAQPRGERVIAGTGAALGDGQRVDAAARRMRPDPERRPQDCVVAVDEAEKVVCARVDVSDAGRNPASQVLFDAAAERPGPRQLQVAVRYLDVRQERRRPRSVDLLVDGGDRAKPPRAACCGKSVCWNAPLVVRCWAKTSIGIRATYDPALARITVRPLPPRSHAIPKRGCRLSRSSGIRPSDGNSGSSRYGAKNVSDGSMKTSGCQVPSQRSPMSRVTRSWGCHVS